MGEGGQKRGGGGGELIKMLLKYRGKGGVCGCAIVCMFAKVVGECVLVTELVCVCVHNIIIGISP